MILTQKSTRILGIIASIIVFAIGIAMVIMPAYNKWSENNESISQAEAEVGLMQSQRDGFLNAQRMYPQLQEVDQALRLRFPELADNDGIITQLSTALVSSGIDSSSLTLTFSAPEIMAPSFNQPIVEEAPPEGSEDAPQEAAPPTPSGSMDMGSISDMAKMNVSITVEGTDGQITQFLNVLHSAERAIVVKQFSVQMNEETGISQLAITSEVYIFARIPNPSDDSATDPNSTEGSDEEDIQTGA